MWHTAKREFAWCTSVLFDIVNMNDECDAGCIASMMYFVVMSMCYRGSLPTMGCCNTCKLSHLVDDSWRLGRIALNNYILIISATLFRNHIVLTRSDAPFRAPDATRLAGRVMTEHRSGKAGCGHRNSCTETTDMHTYSSINL